MATTTKKPVKKTGKTTSKQVVTPVSKASTKAAEAPKKATGSHALIYTADGTSSKEATLPKEMFGGEVNEAIMAQAVRIYLANQRAGTAKVKTRGEVEGSTRKIYKQKGTGKARHGSIRAPIFVGGGIVFGPVLRDYHLNFSKKMKRIALLSAFASKKSDIHIIDGLEEVATKTKQVAKAFAGMGLTGSTLLVVPKEAGGLIRSARNIKSVDIIRATDLFPYAIVMHKHIVFTKKALEESTALFGHTV